ncbi:MAG: PE family protein [Mycobacterium sp.]|uniref:PE family protein n=1 Tax=Mycobacterium sp. TaxID=1785 RepID=UPI003F9DC5B0
MSSFVSAVPEALTTASADLTGIGSSIRAANAAAATSTTEILAALQNDPRRSAGTPLALILIEGCVIWVVTEFTEAQPNPRGRVSVGAGRRRPALAFGAAPERPVAERTAYSGVQLHSSQSRKVRRRRRASWPLIRARAFAGRPSG